MEEYHELAGFSSVANAGALTIQRARKLYDAVVRHRDYSVIKLLQRMGGEDTQFECLIVEVRCNGVPSRNTVGINFRERLMLCVPADPKQLIEVLVLRKDFPVLMHQNQGVIGYPVSLCLYFESAASVLRTWTPQNFLCRIQWWLECSARGELHPTDQPVEDLFFLSKYELILPWNLPELIKSSEHRFVIAMPYPARHDGGLTCFLEAIPKDHEVNVSTSIPIEINLPPMVHGFVQRDPRTLGELAEILTGRGINLLTILSKNLLDNLNKIDSIKSNNNKSTVILIHIPICRAKDAEPNAISHHAFIIFGDMLDLGVAVGAFIQYEGKYFRNQLPGISEQSTEWRSWEVQRMAVLTRNDAAAARKQSGIDHEGPQGVLIGAGSLGSAMLNLWSRAGWGHWTVIDNDYIKPHNLSRHTAYEQHIGQAKACVVAKLHTASVCGATKVTALEADASDFSCTPVTDVLFGAELVIDASTTLEYPRAASAVDKFSRHFSVFIVPNGNAGVLLAEDTQRQHRLRTLEAQYYRALIQNEWGKNHLTGKADSFWSGTSCRDVSAVLPYSRIMGQASTLAEQIMLSAMCERPSIRVWQRDPLCGTVKVYDVPVMAERSMLLGELNLFIDEGVEQQLRDWRIQSLPNETGGILLGYYDFNISAIVVVTGVPAPSDSKSGSLTFERGVVGLAEIVADAAQRTASIVGYIGEWHSHPPGHSASPSKQDYAQLSYLALRMANDGLPIIQMIVGEDDLHVLSHIL